MPNLHFYKALVSIIVIRSRTKSKRILADQHASEKISSRDLEKYRKMALKMGATDPQIITSHQIIYKLTKGIIES